MKQNINNKKIQRSKSFKEKPSYIGLIKIEPKNKTNTNFKNLSYSKREQIVGKRLINNQPNSQRTIDPSLREEEPYHSIIKNISLRSKQSAGVINPDPDNILTYYKEATRPKSKGVHKRSYQNFRFTDTPTNEQLKRAKKVTLYGQDNLMSNVLNQKNKIKQYIQPDAFYEKARAMKFSSDFSSKISCLPGSYTREVKENSKPLRKHIESSYIKENTSLVNKYPEREMNWFCTSRKITHNILEESKERKEDSYGGKRHIHPGVKSQFKSQFELE